MKIIVPFKAASNNFMMRIDINEIAIYMPRIIANDKNEGHKETTIILKSGETVAVNETCENIDKLFKNEAILYHLNKDKE